MLSSIMKGSFFVLFRCECVCICVSVSVINKLFFLLLSFDTNQINYNNTPLTKGTYTLIRFVSFARTPHRCYSNGCQLTHKHHQQEDSINKTKALLSINSSASSVWHRNPESTSVQKWERKWLTQHWHKEKFIQKINEYTHIHIWFTEEKWEEKKRHDMAWLNQSCSDLVSTNCAFTQ